MNYKILVALILLFMNYGASGFAQLQRPRALRKAHVAPDEIVSMLKSTPFNQAMEIFNILSKKFLGKLIIDPEARKISIGLDIDKLHWLDALELILKTHQLWYQEHPDYIKIVSTDRDDASEKAGKVGFKTREAVITAVFFEGDGSKLRQMGFSWDFFRGNDVNVGASMSAAESRASLLELNVNPKLDFGSLVAAFKTLESAQMGEVIASPQITVHSDREGRIQVGSDIGVTIKDFAGNSVTQFFSTGTIIKVKPRIIKHDTIYFIHLDLSIERSNSTTSAGGLEIKKSSAETSILLLDGEETIIGGLYVNEETKSREGIPLLKDIPWWFFGLRYLFGYESKSIIKKELIILLKAELLPTLDERLRAKLEQLKKRPVLLENRLKFRKQMKFYNQQNKRLKIN